MSPPSKEPLKSLKETERDNHNAAMSIVRTFAFVGRWTVVLFALSIFVDGYTELSRRESREKTREILDIIKDQTSPEAIAARETQLGQLLVVVDCNFREALEDAEEARGGSIHIVGGECPGD